MKLKTILMAGSVALLMAGSAGAQTNAAAAAPADEKQPITAVQKLMTAAQLAAYGREAKDPYALLSAARIELAVGASQADFKPAAAAKIAAAATDTKPAREDSADHADDDHKSHGLALLDEAQALARGDKTILAAIETTRSMGSRGATCGCKQGVYEIDGSSRHTFNIGFRGGEPAEVLIVGDGYADLDVKVFNGSGQLVASDTRSDTWAGVRWHPSYTSQYTIQVDNVGKNWSLYRLTTN